MNNLKLLPNDPKLTAYALGELEAEERVAVEELLRDDPAARAAVGEIRALAGEVVLALSEEKGTALESALRVDDPYSATNRSRLLRFPRVNYIVSGLIAASIVVVLALQRPDYDTREARVQQQRIAAEIKAREIAAAMPQLIELPLAEEFHEDAILATSAEASGESAPLLAGGGLIEQSKRMPGVPGVFGDPGSFAVRDQPRDRVVGGIVRGRTWAAEGERATQVAFHFSGNAPRTFAHEPAPEKTEHYAYRPESDFLAAREHPLSTFSADVDTASYANVRRFIQGGQMPPIDAVRIEEMLNYFPYRYEAPRVVADDDFDAAPFAATMEVAEAPWAAGHRLVRIGLKAREVTMTARGAANLVFLLDVSGSMHAANKLPLVKESLRLLLGRLRGDDRVAIVTYAGASGLALASTPVAKAREIVAALDALHSGGSTNGGMGIQLAYDVAKANFVQGGINRVILCTDGDFNVGITDEGGLVRLIEEKAQSGVFLTVLGFGMGNLKDSTMQQLADRGNGNYGYVDSRREAEKLLVEQVSGTLVTIAKDVKLQVEFNAAKVASYRLIGYEKRLLKKEDFNNDTVDAGEIGAGHTVTALYEIVPVGLTAREGGSAPSTVDELKYAAGKIERPRVGDGGVEEATGIPAAASAADANELLTLKVGYKEPSGTVSKKLEFPLVDGGHAFAEASDDFKFAAGVAAFGMLLRDSPHKGLATFSAARDWAEAGSANDVGGYRAEFIELVRRAESLQ